MQCCVLILHIVQLVMDEADWKISGSIFKTNVYRLETIYFNVGENSRIGAEHHVNGKTFPMEVSENWNIFIVANL